MKKARARLEKRGVEYAFHDHKIARIERERL
jgi:arsenate reductase-like glutaredoxin family protein